MYANQYTLQVYIVHPESPWTKDASGRRDFFASRCVRTINFLCTDAQTHARRRTLADERRRIQNFQLHFMSKLLYV